jgi:hypothetical protein
VIAGGELCFRWHIFTKQVVWMLIFTLVATGLSTGVSLSLAPSAESPLEAALTPVLTALGLGAAVASVAPVAFTNAIGMLLPTHMFLPLLDAIDLPTHGLWLGLPWYTSAALPLIVFYPLAGMWLMCEQLLDGHSLQVCPHATPRPLCSSVTHTFAPSPPVTADGDAGRRVARPHSKPFGAAERVGCVPLRVAYACARIPLPSPRSVVVESSGPTT